MLTICYSWRILQQVGEVSKAKGRKSLLLQIWIGSKCNLSRKKLSSSELFSQISMDKIFVVFLFEILDAFILVTLNVLKSILALLNGFKRKYLYLKVSQSSKYVNSVHWLFYQKSCCCCLTQFPTIAFIGENWESHAELLYSASESL